MSWVPVLDATGHFVRGEHAQLYVAPNVGVRPWTKFLTYDEETHFRALEYLRERGRLRPEEPFFLTVSYHNPHDPFHVTQSFWDRYEGAPIEIPTYPDDVARHYSALDRWLNEAHGTERADLGDPTSLYQLRRAYLALVTYIDEKVGELVAALEQSGQLEQTIILFTSDHGDMLGERRMVQKRCFYEWSARIPLIVRYPDGREAGRRVAQPVSLLDLPPTLLAMAGVPEETLLPMDGRSLVGLMRGEDEPRPLFSEYHVEKVRGSSFMVREGAVKYTYIHRHGAQLFDLATDPGEWNNLAGAPAVAELERRLRALILDRFDPEAIEAAGAASVRRRALIQQALERNGLHWDYFPFFDATQQYVR